MQQPALSATLLEIIKTVRAYVDAKGTHTLLVDFRAAMQDTASLIKMWLIDNDARPTDIPIYPVRRVNIAKHPADDDQFVVFFMDSIYTLLPEDDEFKVTYDNVEALLASQHVLQFLETGTYPTQLH